MIKQTLTYKNKYWAFLLVSGLFCIVIYKASIKRTVQLRSDCIEMSEKLESVSKAPEAIKKLQSDIKRLDALFGNTGGDDLNNRATIIEKCSDYCKGKNIRVDQINEPNIQVREDLIIETTEIQFEGKHKSLMQLIHYLETSTLPGKITSVSFRKEINKRSKQERLLLQLFIQSITKTT